MTTISLYIALFLGFNQNKATEYCYEARYSDIIAEAYLSNDNTTITYAKQKAHRQAVVCKYILDKYMSSNRY